MAQVEERWERLVRAVLRRERMGPDAYEQHGTGIAGNVPSSLENNRDIDEILRVADEIQDEDPNISRILCEHGYSLAQNLDPNSEGRGVLQFKTGLMSVIRQKLAKREGATIDRSQDIVRLQEFYKQYRQKNNVEQLREEEMKLRESGVFSGNLGELERKTVKRKRVFATLRVLGKVLEQLTEDIPEEMAREMDEILRQQTAQPANSCHSENDGVSFLDQVIYPLFEIVSAEAGNNENGRAPHSAWRNYDDFNEYFWSLHCFELSWPWRKGSSFFQKPTPRSKNILKSGRSQHRGKTSFVEHRTFLHLYHSFHRLWIFLVMMFQGLAIIAFNGSFDAKCIREILSLGPTFVGMKFLESVLDVLMMYGAYSTTRRLAVSRIFLRFVWFGTASVVISFLYVKALQEESKQNGNPIIYKLYLLIVGIYAGIQFFISFFMRIPACHNLTNQCDRWPLIRLVKWMRQERYYVGRGMYERTTDFIKYMFFWLVILSGKFSFAYFLQTTIML